MDYWNDPNNFRPWENAFQDQNFWEHNIGLHRLNFAPHKFQRHFRMLRKIWDKKLENAKRRRLRKRKKRGNFWRRRFYDVKYFFNKLMFGN